jgi:alpha-N-arabinofuranosidase
MKMKSKSLVAHIIILFLFPAILSAQGNTVTLSVNPNRVVEQIDERIYGQFLEHIYHSVNGGLWGEVVWNRSFEENCSREWNKRFDEIPNNEAWTAKNGFLESPVISETDPRFTIGDGAFRDYDFTVEGCKTSGENGFSVGVRSGSFRRGYLVVLGADGNKMHELQRYTFDKPAFKQVIEVLQSVPGKVETGQWYKIRVRCEGNNIQVWLDGQPLFEINDNIGQQFGQACVATTNTGSFS